MYKFKGFVTVYEYQDGAGHNGSFGTTVYLDVNELYYMEPDAIGHFEVVGSFEKRIECGAV